MAVNCQNFMTMTIHNFIDMKFFVLAMGFEGCFMVQLVFFFLSWVFVVSHIGSKLVAVPLCVHQQADLISLGKVVLALACNSLAGIKRENLQKAMELVSINYSSDLKNLILWASLFLTHISIA